MCLLTYTPEDVWPDLGNLEDASYTNSDGFGFAIVDHGNGRIIRGASLNIDTALTEYDRALRTTHGPSLFHLRWATHGTKDLTNVHPFKSDRGRTAIAHNGIISRVRPTGTESDTAAFVRRYWPSWANSTLDTPATFDHLQRWIGPGNKLVILTTDPRYQSDHYIVNESAGHWSDGTWYSNRSYQWCEYTAAATASYSGPYSVLEGSDAGTSYIIVNGVRRELQHTGQLYPADPATYIHTPGGLVRVTPPEDDGPEDFYPLTCGVCNQEWLAHHDDDRPLCPVCGVCWWCDSDRNACLCGGEV